MTIWAGGSLWFRWISPIKNSISFCVGDCTAGGVGAASDDISIAGSPGMVMESSAANVAHYSGRRNRLIA
ncbi:MAG TPA: hypothetical protein PK667_08125 [Nitrosomonas europaea]|uniref:hypothetical protein n=1 Tax=Nitrosomonas europaea TaxID=915 RepID=UPI0024929E2E|nr:hypothetical protein [Nitrosomonas europaea]HRN81736.1 hypothetical protein [Nitrosomonas europaea]HRO56595.1 hypothetical protein [Nitrosomonas europaea]HRQ08301.1 hypothetical protein [Nitrosomonas europaea]HUM74157.1 hypothetical protein [Nitrosomonas europaea]